MSILKVGFGGGCHWCTEAYFQSLIGVIKVEQGWISALPLDDYFSEAVIVHFNSKVISLKILITIHLHTHSCTSNHSFREKYRSAVYVFDGNLEEAQKLIDRNQIDFDQKIVTRAIIFDKFKSNIESQKDYFIKNKEMSFCKRYIHPKLEIIEEKFAQHFIKI